MWYIVGLYLTSALVFYRWGCRYSPLKETSKLKIGALALAWWPVFIVYELLVLAGGEE